MSAPRIGFTVALVLAVLLFVAVSAGCAGSRMVVDHAERDRAALEWARELCTLGPGERVARLESIKGEFRGQGWLVVGCFQR